VNAREKLDAAVKIVDDARGSTDPKATADAERKLAALPGRHRERTLAA
jgi:hypothetical protein